MSQPGAIHLRIIEVMKRFPEGVSGGQIRKELEKEGLRPEEQTHLDRRKRDLKKWFVIERIESTITVEGRTQNVTLYKVQGGEAKGHGRGAGRPEASGRGHSCGPRPLPDVRQDHRGARLS